MKIDPDTLSLLKEHGFKWHKNGSTDTVYDEDIKDIRPTDDGFEVIYTDKCALVSSRAVVSAVEVPLDIETTWIYVNWEDIDDKRRSSRA